MMFSGLAMQFWQPYMIMMLQYTLGFGANFVIPLAAVILLSAAMAVAGGKLMDKYGKEKFFWPVAAAGVVGGIMVFLIKYVNGNAAATYVLFIVGGTLIESASLLAAGLFNATARDYTPKDKAGCFQGIRIVIYITLPMVIASIFCPLIINAFGPEVLQFGVSPGVGYPVINEGIGYNVGDKVYPFELFLFSALSALLMFVPTYFVYKKNKQFRLEKLRELNVVAQSEDGHADDQPSDGEQAAAQ